MSRTNRMGAAVALFEASRYTRAMLRLRLRIDFVTAHNLIRDLEAAGYIRAAIDPRGNVVTQSEHVSCGAHGGIRCVESTVYEWTGLTYGAKQDHIAAQARVRHRLFVKAQTGDGDGDGDGGAIVERAIARRIPLEQVWSSGVVA